MCDPRTPVLVGAARPAKETTLTSPYRHPNVDGEAAHVAKIEHQGVAMDAWFFRLSTYLSVVM